MDNSVLKLATLDEYDSSYSAEIIAIYEACMLVRGLSSKFAICTDSFRHKGRFLMHLILGFHLQSEQS